MSTRWGWSQQHTEWLRIKCPYMGASVLPSCSCAPGPSQPLTSHPQSLAAHTHTHTHTHTQVERLLPTLTCRETLNFREVCAGQRETLGSVLRAMLSWEAANPELAERTPLDDEARTQRCALA